MSLCVCNKNRNVLTSVITLFPVRIYNFGLLSSVFLDGCKPSWHKIESLKYSLVHRRICFWGGLMPPLGVRVVFTGRDHWNYLLWTSGSPGIGREHLLTCSCYRHSHLNCQTRPFREYEECHPCSYPQHKRRKKEDVVVFCLPESDGQTQRSPWKPFHPSYPFPWIVHKLGTFRTQFSFRSQWCRTPTCIYEEDDPSHTIRSSSLHLLQVSESQSEELCWCDYTLHTTHVSLFFERLRNHHGGGIHFSMDDGLPDSLWPKKVWKYIL